MDLQDVFLRRAKNDFLPFQSLVHLAVDCGLVQHRGPGFREKLRSIASDEVRCRSEAKKTPPGWPTLVGTGPLSAVHDREVLLLLNIDLYL